MAGYQDLHTSNDENCFETELIDGDSTFSVKGMEKFVKAIELDKYGLSYVVVSIIGPQSSGKSTLLNCLFGTNFQEMNAEKGRKKTTDGIWIARSKVIVPLTLVLDVEGTDGSERGENDTNFEKRSALFALTVSDVLLINVWCHDIGRDSAACRPLLRTIFQVWKKLNNKPRGTKLLFVLRDLTSTPFAFFEKLLQEDTQRIWQEVAGATPLTDFFKVEVVALHNYEGSKMEFMEEVVILKQRFSNSTSHGGLVGDREQNMVVPAIDFSCTCQKIWEQIKENKDLNLPSIKEWCQLKEEMMNSGSAPGSVKSLHSLINKCLSEYMEESMSYDAVGRSMHENRLKENLFKHFKKAFKSALKHIRSSTWVEFTSSFDKELNEGGKVFTQAAYDCKNSCLSHFDEECPEGVIGEANQVKKEVREKLECDIDERISSIRDAKIAELISSAQENLEEDFAERVGLILGDPKNSTWQSIRILFSRVTEFSALSNALSGFGMDDRTKSERISSLKANARGVVVSKAHEEAQHHRLLRHMMERFEKLFYYDSYSKARVWKSSEDIERHAALSRSAAVEVLSALAAIRLNADDIDTIDETLKTELLGCGRRLQNSDPLASAIWDQVPLNRTLIEPSNCRHYWDVHFIPETDSIVKERIQKHLNIFRRIILVIKHSLHILGFSRKSSESQ